MENLKWWSRVFLFLIFAACVISLVNLYRVAFWGELRLTVATDEGFRVFTSADFSLRQRLMVVGVMSIPTLFWLAGILCLSAVCFAIDRKELFGQSIVKAIRRFGWCLLLFASSDIIVSPAIGYLLDRFGMCQVQPDSWLTAFTGDMWDYITAAVLMIVLSKLLQAGFEAQDELKLTV